MDNNIKPMGRKDDLVVQEMNGEVLVYDLIVNKAFCLNQTSAVVWQNCDGDKTVAEIARVVSNHLGSEANEDVVWLALDQLGKENLILENRQTASKFSGLSRRDVIKRVGFATAVALPVVTSLIAPLAVHANSACVAGGACACAAAGGAPGQPCATTPVGACADSNCQCIRNNNGNLTGTCGP